MKAAALTALTGIISGCSSAGSSPHSSPSKAEAKKTPGSPGSDQNPQPTSLEALAEDPAVDNVTLNYSFDPNNTTQTARFFLKTQVVSERSSEEEVESLREQLRENLTREQLHALREFVAENTSVRTKETQSVADQGMEQGPTRDVEIAALSGRSRRFGSAPCPAGENPITGTHTHELIVATAVPCDPVGLLGQPDECQNRDPKGWKLIEFKAAEYSNTMSFDVLCPHGVPKWPDSKIGTTTEDPPPKTKNYALYNWKYDESYVQEDFGLRGGDEKVRSEYRGAFARHFIDVTGGGSIRVGTDFADITMEGYKAGGLIKAESESGSTGWGFEGTPST